MGVEWVLTSMRIIRASYPVAQNYVLSVLSGIPAAKWNVEPHPSRYEELFINSKEILDTNLLCR